MNGYEIAAVVLCALAFAANIGYLIVGAFSLSKDRRPSNNSTLFNTFPGEMTKGEKKYNLPVACMAALSAILSLAAYGIYFGGVLIPFEAPSEGIPFSLIAMFLLFFALVQCLAMALSSFTPLSSIKVSLSSWIVLIFATVALGVFQMLIKGNTPALMPINQIPTYVSAGLGFLLLFTMLNPKIKDWAKMEKTEVNGASYWIRPKYNWLAVSVWASYLVNGLYMILMICAIAAPALEA